MIRLTNLADYAVVLMVEVARSDVRVNAQSLAEASRMPVTTVSKILNALSRADLLTSHRGLKGGFSLTRGTDTISLADIVEAIDGPIALTNCSDTSSNDCCYDSFCQVRPHWQHINTAIRTALDTVKLKDVMAPPVPGTFAPAMFEAMPAAGQPAPTTPDSDDGVENGAAGPR